MGVLPISPGQERDSLSRDLPRPPLWVTAEHLSLQRCTKARLWKGLLEKKQPPLTFLFHDSIFYHNAAGLHCVSWVEGSLNFTGELKAAESFRPSRPKQHPP